MSKQRVIFTLVDMTEDIGLPLLRLFGVLDMELEQFEFRCLLGSMLFPTGCHHQGVLCLEGDV